MTKKEEINFIRQKLSKDYRWAIQGLITIFNNQTGEEQITDQTKEYNGIGFTGFDAEMLSSYAKQANKVIKINKKKNIPIAYGSLLSHKQNHVLLKRMPKYAKQLHEEANRNGKIDRLRKIMTKEFNPEQTSFL